MYAEKLQGLSPLAKLTGGYGYVTDKDGNPMLGIAQAQVDENMKILFWSCFHLQHYLMN